MIQERCSIAGFKVEWSQVERTGEKLQELTANHQMTEEKGDLGITDARNWILPTGMTSELDSSQSL